MKENEKPIITTFAVKGTFESYYAACRYLKSIDYSHGSMSVKSPIAIMKGEYNIAQKWKNLSNDERKNVDGIMTSSDFRDGEVTVTLYR